MTPAPRTPTDADLARLLPLLERTASVECLIEALRVAREDLENTKRWLTPTNPCRGALLGGYQCRNAAWAYGDLCPVCSHVEYLAELLGAALAPAELDPAEYHNVEYRRGWEDREEQFESTAKTYRWSGGAA